jgi:ribonuclease HI
VRTAFCDGACRGGNPGFTSCAWVLYEEGVERFNGSHYLGPERHTNNYAEYIGLVALLEWLYEFKIRNVIIHSDSELVVNQTLGNWDVNKEELKSYATKCYGLLVQGCHVLKHIKGHAGHKGNERADELCNTILDAHKEEYESMVKS